MVCKALTHGWKVQVCLGGKTSELVNWYFYKSAEQLITARSQGFFNVEAYGNLEAHSRIRIRRLHVQSSLAVLHRLMVYTAYA